MPSCLLKLSTYVSQLEESVPSGTVPVHAFSFWRSFTIPKHLSTKEMCLLPKALWSWLKRHHPLGFNTDTQPKKVKDYTVRIYSWNPFVSVTPGPYLYICGVLKFLSCVKTLGHESKLLGKPFQGNMLLKAGTLSVSL